MPVGHGTYRVKTTDAGEQVRLHFTPSGRVDEAKNLKTGATHTPAEFKRDRLAARLAEMRRSGKFAHAKRRMHT